MKFVRLLNTVYLVVFTFIFTCCVSYAEEFSADDITSFSLALQEANKIPDENHKINIGGNIILNSSLQEAISLQLVGTDDVNVRNSYYE